MELVVLIAAALAGVAFWRRRQGRGVLAEQLWVALRLQVPYAERWPFTRADADGWVGTRGIEGAVRAARERWQSFVHDEANPRLVLGERAADTSPDRKSVV